VLTRVNRLLIDDIPDGRFVTMLFAIYDPASQKFVLSNAGHPLPLLLTHDDGGWPSTDFIDTCSGLPLGIMDSTYESCEIPLPKNSRLLLYTDGIVEAESSTQEEFGAERLESLLSQSDVTADRILHSVCRFSGKEASDDATVLLLKQA
jgi:sigma-B regulation protein RsbU (phosphoserine phosphatase)